MENCDFYASRRVSPLNTGLQPHRIIKQDGWDIVVTYVGEKTHSPLFVADLSHVSKWTVQGSDLDLIQPLGVRIPAQPGEVTFEKGAFIARLTPEECRIMVFGREIPSFTDSRYTDVTDAFAAFAVVGAQCLDVLSKLSSVDLNEPNRPPLCAAQAPVEEVTCLLVLINKTDMQPGLLILAPRGYGHFLLEVFQDAGKEFGMVPAGWQRFTRWLRVYPIVA